MQSELSKRLRQAIARGRISADNDNYGTDVPVSLLVEAADLIDRLPVTADGVPVYPGMELWDSDGIRNVLGTYTTFYVPPMPPVARWCEHPSTGRSITLEYYSTRAAAEAKGPCSNG